jgi:hypothetical protein
MKSDSPDMGSRRFFHASENPEVFFIMNNVNICSRTDRQWSQMFGFVVMILEIF